MNSLQLSSPIFHFIFCPTLDMIEHHLFSLNQWKSLSLILSSFCFATAELPQTKRLNAGRSRTQCSAHLALSQTHTLSLPFSVIDDRYTVEGKGGVALMGDGGIRAGSGNGKTMEWRVGVQHTPFAREWEQTQWNKRNM